VIGLAHEDVAARHEAVGVAVVLDLIGIKPHVLLQHFY
jgi:hypothetical protein